MTVQNGTIDGVTLVASNPSGIGAANGTRKAFLLSVSFPAFNSGTDSATVTGVNTAIAASQRNGKSLTLIGGVCVQPGQDINGLLYYFTAAASPYLVVANPTTTGDFTGANQLSIQAGTIETTAGPGPGAVDCQILAVVDEGA